MNAISFKYQGKRIVPLAGLLSRENSDGSFVILKTDEDDDTCFKIEGIASRIWKALEGQVNLDTVVEEILVEFDVTREQLHRDVDEFIYELRKHCLLENF